MNTEAERRLAEKAARLEILARGFRGVGSHSEAAERAQSAADIRYLLDEVARLAKLAADAGATVRAAYDFALIVAPLDGKGPPIPKAMHREARAFQKIAAYNLSRHSPDAPPAATAQTYDSIAETPLPPPVL